MTPRGVSARMRASVELVSGRRSRFKNRANFIDSGELFFAAAQGGRERYVGE